jgi:hypothetical protein
MSSAGKPSGLWYGIDDAWLEWCSHSGWLEDYNHFYGLDVSSANILRLATVEEIKQFHDEHKGQSQFVPGFEVEFGDYEIDWNPIRDEYDGIEIAPFQWKVRRDFHWYYSWDIPCGCVWRMRNVSFKEISPSHRLIAKYYKGRETVHEKDER